MHASGLEAALGAKKEICAVDGELTGATPRDRLEGLGAAWERGQEAKGLSGGQELGYKPGAPQDPEQRPCCVSLHPEPCVAAGPGPGTGLLRAAGTAPTLHSSQPSQAGAPPAVPFPLSPDPASPLKAI